MRTSRFSPYKGPTKTRTTETITAEAITNRRGFVQIGGACGLALMASRVLGQEQTPSLRRVASVPDKAKATLEVTSRKYSYCVCAYAQCPQPPKSLCTICCRAFHTELWKTVFGKNVSVEIPESILLGGERCRTTVHILPS